MMAFAVTSFIQLSAPLLVWDETRFSPEVIIVELSEEIPMNESRLPDLLSHHIGVMSGARYLSPIAVVTTTYDLDGGTAIFFTRSLRFSPQFHHLPSMNGYLRAHQQIQLRKYQGKW